MGVSSLETPWSEAAELLLYSSPHWSYTLYHGLAWYWISLPHPSITHYRYTEQPAVISEMLELLILPYIQPLPSAVFQQDNARPHVERNIEKSFSHQIELLPWLACCPYLSPIENEWSMLAQRLARDTPDSL
ncbi:transposable element Tcb1 transposase [Trichonephila clavipes]|nr:transposable element Tcb1 transposase [Trichonephila clavipes]